MKNSWKKSKGGFTLIEMLIVIGIVSLLAGISMFADFGSFRGEAFRGEATTIGTSLQTARANSLNNINQKRHGVAIYPAGYSGYVIFEGDSYATRDASKDANIKSSYNVLLSSGSPTEIVFEQLSGNANYDGNLTLVDPERNMTANILINYEGKIDW